MQLVPVVVFFGLLCAILGGGDLEKGFFVLIGIIEALLFLSVVAIVVVIVWKSYEPVARWYYFTFHPHAAEPTIRAAFASGSVLDGNALADILGEPETGSSIFRAVRAAQANALIDEMQAMTRRQIEEMEARTKEDRAERYEVAAAQQMQAALAEAAIALEQAKAYLNASKRI